MCLSETQIDLYSVSLSVDMIPVSSVELFGPSLKSTDILYTVGIMMPTVEE